MITYKYGVAIMPVSKKESARYALELAETMRAEDEAECKANGIAPTAAIMKSIKDSDEVYEARYHDTLLCLFGLAGNVIWCLGAEAVKQHQKALVAIGYSFIREALKERGKVYNCISKENIPAIRYIEGVAGKEIDLYEGNITINETPFLYFELRRNHV